MGQESDPEIRRAARSAAYRYEALLRRRAPYRRGGGFGSECDEIIGRFCFRFGDDESPDPAPHPEAPEVAAARERAITTHRRWFSVEPEAPDAAGALVRYLVESDRASEAVAAARTHVWASGRTPESRFILGLALHYTGAFPEAEAVFDSARAELPEEDRRRLDDVEVLLEPGERGRYSDLSPEEKAAYERRLWALSDPSLLEPGNERRSAHYARLAWVAIMERAPGVQGRASWGRDQEEILLRYGLPTSRERIRQPLWRLHTSLSMIESFDPHSVSFVPGSLIREGVPEAPPPGVRPTIQRDTARSSYAPVRLHRLRGLRAQVTRIPLRHGWTVRIDASLPPDTVPPAVPVRPRGLVAILDTLGREVARADARVRIGPDSVTVVSGEVAVPPGSYIYRVEVADDSTELAGLAQYALDVPAFSPVGLSDLMLAAPVDSLPESREGLTLDTDGVLGPGRVLIWAEVWGLSPLDDRSRYAVEWWVEPAAPPSLLGRAARWLGRRLGVTDEEGATRVRWEDATRDRPAVVAFTLDLTEMESGLYRLGLIIRDRVSGREGTATRLFLLDPTAPPLRAPDGR